MIVLYVAEQMAKHKMKPIDVSRATGIRPNTVSKYWHDKVERFERSHLDAFCKLFKCQPGDILRYIPDDE